MVEPPILMSGLVVGESPRWHEGRLWFSNRSAQEIVAVDLEGNGEVVAPGPVRRVLHGLVAGTVVFW